MKTETCTLCGQGFDARHSRAPLNPDTHAMGCCPVPTPGPNGLTYAAYSYRIHSDPARCRVTTCGGCFVRQDEMEPSA